MRSDGFLAMPTKVAGAALAQAASSGEADHLLERRDAGVRLCGTVIYLGPKSTIPQCGCQWQSWRGTDFACVLAPIRSRIGTGLESVGKTRGREVGTKRGRWRATMTAGGQIARLVGLAKGCRGRAGEAGRGYVERVSGSASRARRRLSNSGGVERHRGRLGWTEFAILMLTESLRRRNLARKDRS